MPRQFSHSPGSLRKTTNPRGGGPPHNPPGSSSARTRLRRRRRFRRRQSRPPGPWRRYLPVATDGDLRLGLHPREAPSGPGTRPRLPRPNDGAQVPPNRDFAQETKQKSSGWSTHSTDSEPWSLRKDRRARRRDDLRWRCEGP